MSEKKVIYIAGPISGVKEYWKPFEQAEEALTALGYIVLTPTRLPWNIGNDKAMKICLTMIDQADAVYFLPGCEASMGANLEMFYCNYTHKPWTTSLAGLANIWGGSNE